jgi:hypothetical protein
MFRLQKYRNRGQLWVVNVFSYTIHAQIDCWPLPSSLLFQKFPLLLWHFLSSQLFCVHYITTYYGTNRKSETGPLLCNLLSKFHMTIESRSPWLLGCCSRHLRKSCAGVNMVYWCAECVIILEKYMAQKSFAVGRQTVSNICPDKEVTNKTIHGLVTKFRDTRRVCL